MTPTVAKWTERIGVAPVIAILVLGMFIAESRAAREDRRAERAADELHRAAAVGELRAVAEEVRALAAEVRLMAAERCPPARP
jgi:hypothetical protein